MRRTPPSEWRDHLKPTQSADHLDGLDLGKMAEVKTEPFVLNFDEAPKQVQWSDDNDPLCPDAAGLAGEFPSPKTYIDTSKAVRAGRARFVQGGGKLGKLQGEGALVLIDPTAPWLVLAQFDDQERFPYWSHGWHPLPASSFAGIELDHYWGPETEVCLYCGRTAQEVEEAGTFACSA